MRKVYRAAIAAAAVIIMAFGTAAPASAADIDTASVGSRSSVAINLTYPHHSPVVPQNNTIAIVAYFTNHTANSVHVTHIRTCSGAIPGGGVIEVSPLIRNTDTIFDEFQWKRVPSGGCETFELNRTFTTDRAGELFRVVARINRVNEVVAGYLR